MNKPGVNSIKRANSAAKAAELNRKADKALKSIDPEILKNIKKEEADKQKVNQLNLLSKSVSDINNNTTKKGKEIMDQLSSDYTLVYNITSQTYSLRPKIQKIGKK